MGDRLPDSGPLGPKLAPRDLFAELLDHAPVMAILLDAENPVVRANEAARDFCEREAYLMPRISDSLLQRGAIGTWVTPRDPSGCDPGEGVHDSVARVDADRPVTTSIPPTLGVSTDRQKRARAVGKLLDNAAKFS